ncbi:MAG: winged helix-turn-helix transcriptional regulator [Deltaproteobacteria bacterium]|nr:winged helix-turn-helix transcriptional regulator [Deltaproteobacteria bacterium]
MNKADKFEKSFRELAEYSRVFSHPARIAIVKFIAEKKLCISGEISELIPLSRSTVSQHLSELRRAGLIQGRIDGLKINYCLNPKGIKKVNKSFRRFFSLIKDKGPLKG